MNEVNTQYELYAEALLNWELQYQEYLKDPDSFLFLNRFCFFQKEIDLYKAAIEAETKKRGI